MRVLLSFACVWPLIAAGAIDFPLEEFGRPFSPPTNIVIEWKATNARQPTATIYEVAERKFSPIVMSNMLTLGGWKMRERTNVSGRERVPEDKDILHFGRESEAKQLSFYPPAGFIQYRDLQACTSPTGNPHGIPDEAEALRMARAFLIKLEINESELVKDTNGEPRVVRANTIQGRRGIEEVIARSVNFTRQVDGIPFTGYTFGGVGMSFGNDGKLASLEVIWPNLKRNETLPTATPAQLMDYVKRGKTVLRWGPASDELFEDIPKLKRITINDVKAYYLGNSMDEMRKVIFPFATLEITAHLPKTNYTVWLNLPVIAPAR